MNRLSVRTDRRRGSIRTPASLGWVFVLLAMFFCCSLTTSAAAVPPAGTHGSAAAHAMTTPTPEAAAARVVADAPGDRGMGTSCHGTSDHSKAMVLPGPSAPVALPSAVTVVPVAPLTGAAAIRGPANDGVRAVDHLRLQVQRI
ncbi:hypothetical protein OHA98_13875 [Streptomyces sp. NBC_00654]|uniref:hypothetical protein n=1 Tax=Streptomyces sp. NBC_00654 TaxID=2975799 RepID=UPI0022567929|nr:hypothetical protein [Streptomyces sp. NBC_00654]MCX4965909.1 hypothetical protein [Streptomyces sp. NBC_00654]